MNREALKNDCLITLKDRKGSLHTFVIKELLSRQGASCLSYVAGTKSGEEIVLKEFYPKEDTLLRSGLNLDISSVEKGRNDSFRKGIDNLKIVLDIPKLERFICAEAEDARLLEGNGTLYYTNKRVVGKSLKDIVRAPDSYPELILSSARAIMIFLKLLHDKGYAYPDLKAEDILIPYDQNLKCYKYDNPMFYDFDAMIRFGDYSEVDSTYGPFKDGEGPFHVDQISDNMTFAELLDQVTNQNERFKKASINKKIKRQIKQLVEDIRNKENEMDDDTTIKRISKFVEILQLERKLMEKPGFKRENRLIHSIRTLTCFLVSVIYLLIGAVLFSMFYSPEFINRIVDRYYDITLLLTGNVLLCFVILFFLYRIYSYNKKDYDDSLNCEKGVSKYEPKKNADI